MNPSPLQDLLQPNAGYTLASTSLEDMVHTDQSVLSPDDMGPSSPANETNRRGNTCGQARNRATASSPIYGHVTGVLRGPDVVHGKICFYPTLRFHS
jgi:hypothetical protein